MDDILLHLLSLILAFVLISLASNDVGHLFQRWKMPLITGFLFTGILAGPYFLGLIPKETPTSLGFIDEVSLAVIAFAAGSELYLPEVRGRLRSIAWVTTGLVGVTFTVGAIAFVLLSPAIPFMSDMDVRGRIAVGMLAGAILVARSPSSAIAIVNELRAKGPFTSTVLGVTVLMDVVVIVLFTVAFSVASGVMSGRGFDVSSIVILVGELGISVVIAVGLGHAIHMMLKRVDSLVARDSLLLLAGYATFAGSGALHEFSVEHGPVALHLEPLLICMVAAFYITNYTNSRIGLSRTLHGVMPAIYVAFFTLIGASLELDVVAKTWPIAVALFTIRMSTILIGSYAGSRIAGDPPAHSRVAWMSFVTQAGVALGLAKGVGIAFPDWGPSFATTMIALIVLNQVVGPPLFKWAVFLVGEDRVRADTAAFDGVRDALIIGVEGQSLELARVLRANDWQVRLACPETTSLKRVPGCEVEIHPLPDYSRETLAALGGGGVDAIVTLLSDKENLAICEIAYEEFGTRVMVARLDEHRYLKPLRELGVLVIDPSTAMVNLMENCVRSPATTAVMLGLEKGLDMVDVEVGNPDFFGGEVRDLPIPLDVAILCVHRGGDVLPSKGSTKLLEGDLVTLSGPAESVEQAMRKLEA
jgi:Trk K+ transport system NAD-binding subunit/Kef-type K+ transport system membrane component KefB